VAADSLNSRWRDGAVTLGAWLTTPEPAVAEVIGDCGFDYVNVDLQHGLVDFAAAVSVFRALVGRDVVVTCRVPSNEAGIIGKVLDAGAMGVIVPMVNTVEEAERAVRACRYAPAGTRSYGPIRARRQYGADYAEWANEHVSCIPMIETAQAIENLDDILAVDGIDAIYVGPSDLAVSMGLAPGLDNPDHGFQAALVSVLEGCRRRSVVPGIHSGPPLAATRLEQGFRMVTVCSDLVALESAARAALGAATGT
jgi:4-hydroxy-2-oxoheptanedioate aldolase